MEQPGASHSSGTGWYRVVRVLSNRNEQPRLELGHFNADTLYSRIPFASFNPAICSCPSGVRETLLKRWNVGQSGFSAADVHSRGAAAEHAAAAAEHAAAPAANTAFVGIFGIEKKVPVTKNPRKEKNPRK